MRRCVSGGCCFGHGNWWREDASDGWIRWTAAMDSGDGCDKRRRAVVSTTSASSDAWLVEESRGTVWTVGNKESES